MTREEALKRATKLRQHHLPWDEYPQLAAPGGVSDQIQAEIADLILAVERETAQACWGIAIGGSAKCLEWAHCTHEDCRDLGCGEQRSMAKACRNVADAISAAFGLVNLGDRKGGDMDEWPEDLRVREMPAAPSEKSCEIR